MSHLQSSSTRPPVHVDDLPSEILREIFIATYPPELFELGSDVSPEESISLPRRLSHVSRHWRREALSYGELWSYLTLTHREFERNWQTSLELFLTFLERTNTSPINFRLRIYPIYTFQPRRAVERMISSLLEQQRRWKNVALTWRGEISRDFQRLQISDVPLVNSLYLHVEIFSRDGEDNTTRTPAYIDIRRSPRIEVLDLSGDYRLDIGELPTYELLRNFKHQPRYLPQDSYTSSAEICLKILDLAPNLQHVHLSFSPQWAEMGRYNINIGEPRLHRVKELDLNGYLCIGVIKNLHVPELEKLRYMSTDVCKGRTLLSMIRRSYPPLTCLRVPYIPDDTLLEILHLLPTLVELEIYLCFGAAALFRGLTVRNRTDVGNISPDKDETALCPRLRSLQVYILGSFTDESTTEHTDALFSMLDSRMEIMGTCNKVILKGFRRVPEERTEVLLMRRDHDQMKKFLEIGGCMAIKMEKD